VEDKKLRGSMGMVTAGEGFHEQEGLLPFRGREGAGGNNFGEKCSPLDSSEIEKRGSKKKNRRKFHINWNGIISESG